MNIVIAGAGKFGKELTENLSKLKHNVTIIDNKSDVIEEVVNQYDVMGYCGNAASYTTQIEASIARSDLFIATASTDETNILSCMVAKKLKIKQTVARIRNPEYANYSSLMLGEGALDIIINPDLDTALEIFRILRFPSAIKLETFANGKVDLAEIKIEKDSLLNEKSLIDIRDKFQVKVLVCAVKRGEEVIIPSGKFVLQEGDYVYITAESKKMSNSFKKLNLFKDKLRNVMIVGGGRITYYLTSLLLDEGIAVKIVEKDLAICKKLAETFPDAVVIHGDATNQRLLLEEGLETTDSIVTLTGMDETNIIVSSFSKNKNVNKVITKVNNANYETILSNIGLDSVVSPKEIFCSHIIRHIRGMGGRRGSEFKTLYRLVGNKVEALEFTISKSTRYTGMPLKNLKIKSNYLLACIIRNNKVIIPTGSDTLEPSDSVVIITTDTEVMDVSDILE